MENKLKEQLINELVELDEGTYTFEDLKGVEHGD